MGWKLSAAAKRIVCASATDAAAGTACATVVFDMNAVCRREFIWKSFDVPPAEAVAIFWRRHVAAHSSAVQFYFAFDSADRIPDVRRTYLAETRYANRVVTHCAPFEAHKMQNTWAEVWASATAKAAMWDLIAACLHAHARQMGAPGVQYTIDPPSGPLLQCPALASDARLSHFGEADLKAALFAKEYAVGETLVYTIDWDMVVQGAAVLPTSTTLDMGSVWEKDGTRYYSKRNAPASAARVRERLRPGLLPIGDRLSYAFLLLAAGGVDYCDGLKGYGYREPDMVRLLATSGEPFIAVAGPRYTFDPDAFVRRLSPVKAVRARCKDAERLQAEIGRMWYCLLYFAFVGRWAERGGPRTITDTFFPGATSAQAALTSTGNPPVVYVDDDAGL
ncbi:hypothetical protein [Nereida ignava]|uniref:hypothetical protein n=1 Tax=Nereida ignava TaxID=282199 RepID=UPI0030F58E88